MVGISYDVVVAVMSSDIPFPHKWISSSPANEHIVCMKDIWSSEDAVHMRHRRYLWYHSCSGVPSFPQKYAHGYVENKSYCVQ
jgi:hypothetical protein